MWNTKQNRANHIDSRILVRRQATKKVYRKKGRHTKYTDNNATKAINIMRINRSYAGTQHTHATIDNTYKVGFSMPHANINTTLGSKIHAASHTRPYANLYYFRQYKR